MNDTLNEAMTRAQNLVETESMRLAAASLQHYLKLNDEKITIEEIVRNVRASIDGELNNETDDLDGLLVSQARMLDATFNYFMHRAKGTYSEEETVNLALKAQRQAERTIKSLRRMRQQKHEKIKISAERTRQTDA